MSRWSRLAVFFWLVWTCACHTDRYEPHSTIPHVDDDRPPSSRPVAVFQGPLITASGEEISLSEVLQRFITRVAAFGDEGVRFGALPLVTYEQRHPSPWVSELGIRIADVLCERLADAGYRGVIRTPRELEAEMRREGLNKSDLVDVASVAALARKLDLDVIAFGTLTYDRNVGRNGRDIVTLDLTALQFVTPENELDREIAHERIEIPSDIERNRAFFELAQRESLWLATGS